MRYFSSRKRIRGVSFHYSSSKLKLPNLNTLNNTIELPELSHQIQLEMPRPLNALDIEGLMHDQGRNVIHTLVSECVDFIEKWTGIVKIIERCFLKNANFRSDILLTEQTQDCIHLPKDVSVYLEAKALLALWKHRLTMLQMISEAQSSLRFSNFKSHAQSNS